MTSTNHGGDIVAKVLQVNEITHIFTLTGGHISPILIGCDEVGIKVVDVRAEVNAAFAADAYSRLSGKVGVAVVTAGPGVSNTITALKNAQLAESPLLLIGGATATMLEGRGALQDIDQLTLLKSTTKWQTSVRKVKEIIPKLEKALKIAKEGVPGPVFVEMPVDILYKEEIVKEWYGAKSTSGKSLMSKIMNWYINRHVNKIFDQKDQNINRISKLTYSTESNFGGDIIEVKQLIENAERPVILASSQIVSTPSITDNVVSGLEKLQIPVYLSGMARGLLGKNHKLHYKHKRTAVLKQSDLIILLGTPLDFRLDYGRKLGRSATAVSVNLSKDTLKMNRTIRKLEKTIKGHPGEFILQLASNLQSSKSGKFEDWHTQIRSLNQEREEQINQMAGQEVEPKGYVNPLQICQAVEDRLDENSVIVADGGDFVATFSYIANPRGPLQWLDPGPYGTLGVGAGFALGAKSVNDKSTIWLIYGDGALGFSMSEFDTFVRHKKPVIAIVGNDASWQQIAREQVEIFGSDLATSLDYSNYHEVIEGFGAKGLLIESNEQIEEVLDKALELHSQGHAVLVNVLIGSTEFRKGSISM